MDAVRRDGGWEKNSWAGLDTGLGPKARSLHNVILISLAGMHCVPKLLHLDNHLSPTLGTKIMPNECIMKFEAMICSK